MLPKHKERVNKALNSPLLLVVFSYLAISLFGLGHDLAFFAAVFGRHALKVLDALREERKRVREENERESNEGEREEEYEESREEEKRVREQREGQTCWRDRLSLSCLGRI